jgi:hypothetical protein
MTHPVKANLTAIASAIPAELLMGMDASNIKMVRPRTIQFDLAKPGLDGTNRVKVTVENGTFLIRGYRIDETEVLYGVQSEAVAQALKTITTPQ